MDYEKAYRKLVADIRDTIAEAVDEVAKSNLQHLHVKIYKDTLTGITELLYHSNMSVMHQPKGCRKLRLAHLVTNLDGKLEILNMNLGQAEDSGMVNYLCEEALDDINKLVGD